VVPVNELGANAYYGAEQVEYAASTTGTWDAAAAAGNTVYGPIGAPISGALTANRSKVVRFSKPIQASDKIFLEFQVSGGQWVEQAAYAPWLGPPAVDFGALIISSSGTDVTVTFAQYWRPGTTWNSLTGAQNWSAGASWRLRKVTTPGLAGFNVATPTQPVGLYQAGAAPGAGGTAIQANCLGYQIQSRVTAATNVPAANGNLGDATSISLPPGIWDISAISCFNLNGATCTLVEMGISTTSGNSSTGLQYGDNFVDGPAPTVSVISTLTIPAYRVTVPAGSNVTYYLKMAASYSSGTPQHRSRLSAVLVG